MKKIIFFFVSLPLFAQVSPTMNSGEVKINYPCDITSKLSLTKEEKESITFFEIENNAAFRAGYIFRRRVNKTTSEADFTAKFRSKSSSIILDQKLFQALSDSPNGEMKCEFDISYHHIEYTPTWSCSFKSDTPTALSEHKEFVKMVNIPVRGLPADWQNMKETKISSTSWKLKLSKTEEARSPFEKKISVEKWVKGDQCRLEVSGKLTANSADPKVIHQVAGKGFKFIKEVIPYEPSPEQGMKTAWALGIK